MARYRQRFAILAAYYFVCWSVAAVGNAEEPKPGVENFFNHVVDVNVQHVDAKPPIFPAALKPGDLIEIIAPAKYLDKERVTLATKRLEEMGFKVRHPKNLFRKKGFLGGTDEERTAELMSAFADPEVKAIMPGTGGYGTTRIIDDLDYDVIRKNPKILVGFSDITGLHIAINQRTGLVTFH
jgi:muramoyltetrapeptide carboxypeptidase